MTETKTQQIGDMTVVELSGRLYLGNSLHRQLRTRDADLLRGRMRQSGGRMRVVGAGGTVVRVFEIANASRILRFDPDLAWACRNLSTESAAG
jgi:hypothetical protein